MKSLATGWLERARALVWEKRQAPVPPLHAAALRGLRTLMILARDLLDGQLTLRAMGLVYTTLLSIVPLLALSFSVLKAFGVHNQIRPMLLRFLAPLGEQGAEIADSIVSFIQNMNVGVLGALGLALLLYTAISLMHKIEESLNFIWHVARERTLGERFSRYLSALMVGPILVFSALGITGTLSNIDSVRDLLAIDAMGQMVQIAGRIAPYLLVIAALTFVYWFIPNARVRLGPALVGGVLGGIVWQTAGWAFAAFVTTSNNYAAIYSGLAILVLFMIWLYLSWLILLLGAALAFYAQHPEYLYAESGEPRLSNRLRERLGLSAMSLVAGRFLAGGRAHTREQIARLLCVPMHSLQIVLDALESAQLLVQSADDPPRYLPARELALISVAQVLDTVRAAGENRYLAPDALPVPAPVEALLERVQRAVDVSLGGMSLRELAAGEAGELADGSPAAGEGADAAIVHD